MLVVQEQHRLPRLDVAYLDAVRIAGLCVRDEARHAKGREILIGEAEEMREGCGIKTADAKRHG